VTIYSIKGKIIDLTSNPYNNKLKIQAMDSDTQFFEDHNDDLLGSAWTKPDKSFEITFDDLTFNDNWLEKSPEIYLLIRNESGQIIHKTEILKIDSNGDNKELVEIPITINLDSIEETKIGLLDTFTDDDIYFNNSQRILSAFSSLGDVVTLNNSNAARNFQLLSSSINAWLIYTNELSWKRIGYDGPQVPRYAYKTPDHSHRLTWEGEIN
jgi:hypothetical protein